MTDHIESITEFGDYSLLKQLTKGSIAEILLARKNNEYGSRKFHIIKRLSPHISTNTEKLQAFVRECETAISLSHENIVPGNDYGSLSFQGEQCHFLVMDYVFGKNLAQILGKVKPGFLPIDIACSIIYSVSRGLIHAHTYCDPLSLVESPIVHKDISPDNIIVSYRGETKITDFGISQVGAQGDSGDKIKGKPSYMSPEQRKGVFVDPRSDIYSLGVVFWECLTGEKLFTSAEEEGSSLLEGESATSPRKKNRYVPQEISKICLKCLEFSPKDRYQSAQELRNALIRCASTGQFSSSRLKKFMLKAYGDEFKSESTALREALEPKKNNTRASLSEGELLPHSHDKTTSTKKNLTNSGGGSMDKEHLSQKVGQFFSNQTIEVDKLPPSSEQTVAFNQKSVATLPQPPEEKAVQVVQRSQPLLQAKSLSPLVNEDDATITDHEITMECS